jgi:hypothetical protein
MRRLSPTLTLVVLFQPVLAQPMLAQTAVRDLVIEVGRVSNCLITQDIADATFPQFDLSQEVLDLVVGQMAAQGEVDFVDGTLRLSPKLCTMDPAKAPAPPSVSPVMLRVVEAYRAADCLLAEAEAPDFMAAAGIAADELASVGQETEALVAAGHILRDPDAGTVTITEPLCSRAAISPDPLVKMLTENGCALTKEASSTLIEGYGLTVEAAEGMAATLVEQGLARIEGDSLILETCGG